MLCLTQHHRCEIEVKCVKQSHNLFYNTKRKNTNVPVLQGEMSSYPVNLRVLQQELHYLCMASSGCKVQRGAELAVQQVWITVTFFEQQLCRIDFTVPG